MLEAMSWCRDQALIAMAGKVKEIQGFLAIIPFLVSVIYIILCLCKGCWEEVRILNYQ